MLWQLSHCCSDRARRIADRHYNRQKPGSIRFVKPGRCIVLLTEKGDALWVSSWPFAEYVKHAWPGAWECSYFRNESPHLASNMIRDAVAITRSIWNEPPPLPLGMVSFINPRKVRGKPRRDYGLCYQKAGWRLLEERTKDGLFVVQMLPDGLVDAAPPLGHQTTLFAGA